MKWIMIMLHLPLTISSLFFYVLVLSLSQELGQQERLILKVKQHLVKDDDCQGKLSNW